MFPFRPLPPSSSSSPSLSATVLGAGVIGLTQAIILQRNGFKVHMIANSFPSSPSFDYCSDKSGAHWFSFANSSDSFLQLIDKITYHFLYSLAILEPKSSGITRVYSNAFKKEKPREIDKYISNNPNSASSMTDYQIAAASGALPWFHSFVHSFHLFSDKELKVYNRLHNTHFSFGYRFESIMIHCPIYLNYLFDIFIKGGGTYEQKRIIHIDDIVIINQEKQIKKNDTNNNNNNNSSSNNNQDFHIIINATGLGSLTLGGVEDNNVYSVKGQSILINAPEIKEIIRSLDNPGTYILPRGDGTVLLGGTYLAHNNSINIDPFLTNDILQRCSYYSNQIRSLIDNNKLSIISEFVGLRPFRTDGIRLEINRKEFENEKIILLQNYGHAGGGFQGSWGSAIIGLQLLEEEINKIIQEPHHNTRKNKYYFRAKL